MPRTMSVEWFSSLPKPEQEQFKKNVLASKKVLDKLSELCYNKITVGESSKLTDYDSPSWSHKQAHINGRNEVLREIIQLISLPDQG